MYFFLDDHKTKTLGHGVMQSDYRHGFDAMNQFRLSENNTFPAKAVDYLLLSDTANGGEFFRVSTFEPLIPTFTLFFVQKSTKATKQDYLLARSYFRSKDEKSYW